MLHAQPILDLNTDEVSQYELLLRMVDDDGELVPPAAFLGVAERFGLVQSIDRWVVAQAIRLMDRRLRTGEVIRLEVNLSGRSVDDPELPVLIQRELDRTDVDPDNLILEITETSLISNMDEARRFAETLTRVGCRFALDDFGAGFGSYYYLKHLPLHYIKIDGDFIRQLPTSPTDQLMVKAMVQVASGLGMKTIAEFVEDEAIIEFLRALRRRLRAGLPRRATPAGGRGLARRGYVAVTLPPRAQHAEVDPLGPRDVADRVGHRPARRRSAPAAASCPRSGR